MRRLPLLLVVVLASGACAPEGAGTTSTAGTATTQPARTTTAPTSTTTTVPLATTSPISPDTFATQLFDLTGIGEGSVSAYAGAGTSFEAALELRAGTRLLEATGRTDESIDGTVWRELSAGTRSVWVDDAFLMPVAGISVAIADDPCSSFGTPTGELARSGPASSSADHVAQIWQQPAAACTRLVIALGEDFAFDGSGPLADDVPADVSVEGFGSMARITMPGVAFGRFDATEDFGELTVLVARNADGSLHVDVLAGAPSEFFARFLDDPARIVLDVLPANVAAASLAAPILGEGVVLAVPPPPEVRLPLSVSGYSRWFEATGTLVVRRQADVAGTGEVVAAVVTGDSVVGEARGAAWGITSTDWIDAWGTFAFEIDGLAPGRYEIFIGECRSLEDGDGCQEVGIHLPITVER